MASVTLGSSSPTYKLAEGDAPAPAPEPVPACGVPASSPEGEGDSLGEGIELLSSPLDSAGTESTDVAAAGADLSSLARLATGDAVSTALLVADIMKDAR